MAGNFYLIGLVITVILLICVPASAAGEYTLGIFGNANEDDTINIQDMSQTEQIILEYKDKTQLADAKYDDEIDMLDVTQIELIILEKEKELTFLDIFGEAETVKTPINRLANLGTYGLQVTRMVNAEDIMLPVVGWPELKEWRVFYSEFVDWPAVGLDTATDFEYILRLNPDAVQPNFEMSSYSPASKIELKRLYQEKLPGIPIISLDLRTPNELSRSVRMYGYIVNREEEAQEFIDWHDKYMDIINTRVAGIPDYEKPRYYIVGAEFCKTKTSKDRRAQAITIAGGINIVDELIDMEDPASPTMLTVDKEWIIEQNPDYIIRIVHPGTTDLSGYMLDDTEPIIATRKEIMDSPDLANVKAVINGNVYIVDGHLNDGGGNTIIGSVYAAKLFYPDLLEDIDPQTVHQEYVDKFCRFDFDVREHGVFLYPPLGQ